MCLPKKQQYFAAKGAVAYAVVPCLRRVARPDRASFILSLFFTLRSDSSDPRKSSSTYPRGRAVANNQQEAPYWTMMMIESQTTKTQVVDSAAAASVEFLRVSYTDTDLAFECLCLFLGASRQKRWRKIFFVSPLPSSKRLPGFGTVKIDGNANKVFAKTIPQRRQAWGFSRFSSTSVDR